VADPETHMKPTVVKVTQLRVCTFKIQYQLWN